MPLLLALLAGLVLVPVALGFGEQHPNEAFKRPPLEVPQDVCLVYHGWVAPGSQCLDELLADLRVSGLSGLPRSAWGGPSNGRVSACATSATPMPRWTAVRFEGPDGQLFTDDDVLPTRDETGVSSVARVRQLVAETRPTPPPFGLEPAEQPGCGRRVVGAQNARVCVGSGVIAIEFQNGLDLVCDVGGCLCGSGYLPERWTLAHARAAYGGLYAGCVTEVPGLTDCADRLASEAAPE